MSRPAVCTFAVPLLAVGLVAGPAPAQVVSEVVFRVGNSASIDWFVINDPRVNGTLNVTNAPYGGGTNLNAAAVDVGRNRLTYHADGTAYAINLAGLQLRAGATTPVTVSPSLGIWPSAGPNGGYRKADGQVYYRPELTVELRRLNYDAFGQIADSTSLGNLNGPASITAGDLDFAGDGSIWMSGNGPGGGSRLWHFDFTTRNTILNVATNNLYNGITFNAAGTSLFGYARSTGQFGAINLTTGEFLGTPLTDPTLFGVTGDLATGTLMPIVGVPEPSSLVLVGLAVGGLGFVSRRRRRPTAETAR